MLGQTEVLWPAEVLGPADVLVPTEVLGPAEVLYSASKSSRTFSSVIHALA